MGRETRRREKRDLYTGGELERDIFGEFKVTPAYKKKYQEYVQVDANNPEKKPYTTMRHSLELVRDYYVDDPTNPEKDFANDARIEIAEKLGIPFKEQDRLKFYTSVGKTSLDVFHGVDAFFELEDEDGDIVARATLDASKNPHKRQDDIKADVHIPEMPAPEEEEYIDMVEEQSDKIVKALQDKMRRAA